MNYEKYTELQISSDGLEYQFISTGPKGSILKIIQFRKIPGSNIFNLAFGNLNDDGSIDDLSVNDNKDRNKILATVAFVVYEFSKDTDDLIFFAGSTPERTRLYRIAITSNLEILSADFEIFGVLQGQESFTDVAFEKGADYYGFLIKRKCVNFII